MKTTASKQTWIEESLNLQIVCDLCSTLLRIIREGNINRRHEEPDLMEQLPLRQAGCDEACDDKCDDTCVG